MSLDDFQFNLQHTLKHQGQYWALRKMSYFLLLPFCNSKKATISPIFAQLQPYRDKEIIYLVT